MTDTTAPASPPEDDATPAGLSTDDGAPAGPPAAAPPATKVGPAPWLWVLMGAIVLVALVIGTRPDDTPRTNEDRAHALADGLKCPTCRSQSVADSDAPVSKEIRAEINRRIESGDTDEEIRDYLVDQFGEDVVLTPSASGVTGLVWVLPVVLLIAGGTALGFAFRRWRRRSPVSVTDDDRELVEQTRRQLEEEHPS